MRLDTEGSGLNVSLRITKKEGEAVHLVPEGTPGATVVAVKRVNELGYYNMGLKQLAENIGLSMPKTLVVVDELGLKGDVEFFKVIKIGKMVHKHYSKKALDVIREKLPNMNIDEVWSRNKPQGKRKIASN